MVQEAVRKALTNSEQWNRRSYIGASEISACPLELYYKKSGGDDFRGSGKTVRGHAVERAFVQLLKKGGLDVRYHDGHVNHQRELIFSGYPVVAHPDGIIYEKGKPAAVLEVKSVSSMLFQKLDSAYERWIIQSRLNAHLAGVKKAVLAAVDASDFERVKEWSFVAMSEAEAQELGEKAKRIFQAIELGIEPAAEPSADNCKYCSFADRCANRWIPTVEEKETEVEADEVKDALEAMRRVSELKEEIKQLEKWAKPELLSFAKEHKAGRLKAGGLLAVLTPRRGSVRLATKKMKAELPDLPWEKYEKKSADTIALKIKEVNDE